MKTPKPIKNAKAEVSTKVSKSSTAIPGGAKSKQKAGSAPKNSEAAGSTKTPGPAERLDAIGIEVICKQIIAGMSLRAWALNNGFVQQSVINWIDADKDRAGHYASAREDREQGKFELLEDIGDQAVRAETAVEVAGLRLKSDNIKWMLARMNSKKYGDKTTLAGDSDNPLVIMSAAERDARIAELLAKNKG